MDDLISKKAAIDAVVDELDRIDHVPQWVFDVLSSRIKSVPSAEPQIIHCKECKFAHMTYRGECKYCDIWFPDEKCYMDGDYYCASAERRTNEND